MSQANQMSQVTIFELDDMQMDLMRAYSGVPPWTIRWTQKW